MSSRQPGAGYTVVSSVTIYDPRKAREIIACAGDTTVGACEYRPFVAGVGRFVHVRVTHCVQRVLRDTLHPCSLHLCTAIHAAVRRPLWDFLPQPQPQPQCSCGKRQRDLFGRPRVARTLMLSSTVGGAAPSKLAVLADSDVISSGLFSAHTSNSTAVT